MPVDFYYLPQSPPCRTVMLLAKALGVHLNLRIMNVATGEHMNSPEFLEVVCSVLNLLNFSARIYANLREFTRIQLASAAIRKGENVFPKARKTYRSASDESSAHDTDHRR